MPWTEDPTDLLQDLIDKAKKAGACAADALLFSGVSMSHARRLGELERVEREESQDLGLRVLLGKRQAMVSSNDIAQTSLDALVERALAMAGAVPEDPYCGLADPDQLAATLPELDIYDPEEPSPMLLVERAKECEEAARAVDGVTNSEGAEASWSHSGVWMAATNGFAGSYMTTRHGLGVAVLAGEGLGMERDYEFSSQVFGADLDDPATVGQQAGERAVRRLDARKPRSGRFPVIFDPRVSGSLLRHLAGAINGAAVARGTSFLKDQLGKEILPRDITVFDDPHRLRGLRSKPFDGEGLANERRAIVDQGRLTGWILDLGSARQLGLSSTGNASRGTASPPGPAAANFYLQAGEVTPAELMRDIHEGLYITEMMGMGVSLVTGDYSRGAAGFWIDQGEIAYPVNEVTVAGNLKDMFASLRAANDLKFRFGTDAPTLRVEGMTVAGL